MSRHNRSKNMIAPSAPIAVLLPEEVLRHRVPPSLKLKELVRMDSAVCSKAHRKTFLSALSGHYFDKKTIGDNFYRYKVNQKLIWFKDRGVSLRYLLLDKTHPRLIKQFPSVFPMLQRLHISTLQKGLTHDWTTKPAIASLEELVVVQTVAGDEVPLLGLLKAVPNLRKFAVHGDPMCADEEFLTDQTLLMLATHCPQLRSLQSDGDSMHLDDSVMELFFSSCRFLESLRLQWDQVRNSTLELMGLHCAHLRKLELSYNRTVTDDGLLAVVKGCRHLVVLSLNTCHGITSSGLAVCGPHCTQLLDVFIELPQLDVAVVPFFKHVNGLVNISGGFNAEIVKQASVYWTAARYVELSGTDADDETITCVARHCVLLRHLILMGNKRLTDVAMLALATHAVQLQSLEIFDSEIITDDGFIALAEGCAGLQYFSLSKNYNFTYCSAVALARRCAFDFCGPSLHNYDAHCAKLKVYNEQSTWYEDNSLRYRRKVKVA